MQLCLKVSSTFYPLYTYAMHCFSGLQYFPNCVGCGGWVCSRRECTHSTVLYGSTQADEICGHDHTVNEIFDFLP